MLGPSYESHTLPTPNAVNIPHKGPDLLGDTFNIRARVVVSYGSFSTEDLYHAQVIRVPYNPDIILCITGVPKAPPLSDITPP